MAYTPKAWVTGEVITAAALNNLETGVDNAHAGNLDAGAIGPTALATGAVTGVKIANGFTFVQRVVFTGNGTFSKGSYSWLRAFGVHVLGGGGAGGGANTTGAGQASVGAGGGGGAYAWRWVTDIASVNASATVTVGAGGTGSTGSGSAGGGSSFQYSGTTVISASGGDGGLVTTAGTPPRITAMGRGGTSIVNAQVAAPGGNGTGGVAYSATVFMSGGGGMGAGPFGGGGAVGRDSTSGNGGTVDSDARGAGGGGGVNGESQVTARSGSDGAAGLVVLDLYA